MLQSVWLCISRRQCCSSLSALNLNENVGDENFYADSVLHHTWPIQQVNLFMQNHKQAGKNICWWCHGLQITHTETAFLETPHGNVRLNDVSVISNLKKNLLLVSQLTNDNSYIF